MHEQILPERAFLVHERDVARGRFPNAEAVFLVDLSLVHRYPGARYLTLEEAPPDEVDTPIDGELLPVVVIDPRQSSMYEGVRPATILNDRRRGAEHSEAVKESFSLTA